MRHFTLPIRSAQLSHPPRTSLSPPHYAPPPSLSQSAPLQTPHPTSVHLISHDTSARCQVGAAQIIAIHQAGRRHPLERRVSGCKHVILMRWCGISLFCRGKEGGREWDVEERGEVVRRWDVNEACLVKVGWMDGSSMLGKLGGLELKW